MAGPPAEVNARGRMVPREVTGPFSSYQFSSWDIHTVTTGNSDGKGQQGPDGPHTPVAVQRAKDWLAIVASLVVIIAGILGGMTWVVDAKIDPVEQAVGENKDAIRENREAIAELGKQLTAIDRRLVRIEARLKTTQAEPSPDG